MLIAITGKKGSGKDTFAAPLIRQNFVNLKMADVLKEMLRTLYRLANVDPLEIERKIEGDLKEEPCDVLGGATPRWAMQSIGNEWTKMVDPTHTLWSRIFEARVKPLLASGTPVVCTDLRFQHELDVIRKLGGIAIRIVRPSVENNDTHASELELEGLEVDETVYNLSTTQELERKLSTILKDYM